MPWPLFILEVTNLSRRSLRRYSPSATGPCHHDARVVVEGAVVVADRVIRMGAGDFAGDPRWPLACSCGYSFTEADVRQVFVDAIYKAVDTGKLYTLRDAPAGAMWDAAWMNWPDYKGPDGKSWCVRMPGGPSADWMVYGFSTEGPQRTQGPKWHVVGNPPKITVAPSINLTGVYHGFIRDGIIGRDVEGRTFQGEPA